MISQPFDLDNLQLNFTALPTEAITFSEAQLDQAVELSEAVPNYNQQWQTYLNALGVFAFQQWLQERGEDLYFDPQKSSLYRPEVNQVLGAVSHLEIDQYRLCLLTVADTEEEEVIVPRAIVDLPEFIPHFYVLVEVKEEQETAVVRGFLSYPDLLKRQAEENLEAEEDWTYELPLTWFTAQPDRLLLYLRCLAPHAISLPAPSQPGITAAMQEELSTLLPQLQSPQQELWQLLDWSQGKAVLTNDELLQWVYTLQTTVEEEREQSLVKHLQDLLQLLSQPALNVGRWLWDELDQMAQELSWQLVPELTPAALRSPSEEITAIVEELLSNGITIPSQARGAYRDFNLAGQRLRLYGITWPLLPTTDTEEEWTLLLVLGTSFDDSLPPGVELRVSDRSGILFERRIDADDNYPYFFTRLIGTYEDKFVVTISLTQTASVTLPPLAFELQRTV